MQNAIDLASLCVITVNDDLKGLGSTNLNKSELKLTEFGGTVLVFLIQMSKLRILLYIVTSIFYNIYNTKFFWEIII